jgi:tetratricopeptide (TPR) repeat protein
VTPLLAAGLLLLPAQTGVPPTGPQDKVIDVRASRAPAGNTFEALWAAYEKAVAKNDQETARNVLREIRRLRIERNILALDTFALAHVDQGLDLLRKGDRERAEGEFEEAAALDPYLPDASFGMSLVELEKIPLGILPAVKDIVTGVAAPLNSAHGRQRAFTLGTAALLLALFATTTVVALAFSCGTAPCCCTTSRSRSAAAACRRCPSSSSPPSCCCPPSPSRGTAGCPSGGSRFSSST